MKYRTDLILGEAFCIFIFFYFLDSGLSVLNGLQFYFWLRGSENLQYCSKSLRACLHGGGGPQGGEVTRFGGYPPCTHNLSF